MEIEKNMEMFGGVGENVYICIAYYPKQEMEGMIEYELIDISFESGYELPEEKGVYACENGSSCDNESSLEYDADGIPMGDSQEEKLIRRNLIHKFIQAWRNDHENPCVFNEYLHEYIKVSHVFLLESVLHSSIRYQSTKFIMRMEEVMAKAKEIGEVNTKEGNSNQKPFEKMIVMRYDFEELGSAKMTVGVRNRTHEKVAYSITHHESDTPFIDDALRIKNKTKGKKRKKRFR